MARLVAGEPLARLDYAVAVDAADLSVPASLRSVPSVRLLIAAELGPVRLIDNCAAPVPAVTAGRSLAATAGDGQNPTDGRARPENPDLPGDQGN
jgi:hypothetical protein